MQYMAIGNHGNTFHGLKHPRKDLFEKMGRSRASKMYHDTENGPIHIGYIVAGEWFRLYEVKPFSRKA